MELEKNKEKKLEIGRGGHDFCSVSKFLITNTTFFDIIKY
jgi:hypothetical protein